MAALAAAPAAAQQGPPRAAQAATLQAVVTRVSAGDSLWVTPPGQPPLELRLRDIDAPELCQAWGVEARDALAELVLHQTVSVRLAGRDREGRALATLLRVGELDVAQRQVEQGHAWSVRGRNDRGPYVKQERVAASLQRGLHGMPGHLRPEEFRKRHGPCKPDDAGMPARRP